MHLCFSCYNKSEYWILTKKKSSFFETFFSCSQSEKAFGGLQAFLRFGFLKPSGTLSLLVDPRPVPLLRLCVHLTPSRHVDTWLTYTGVLISGFLTLALYCTVVCECLCMLTCIQCVCVCGLEGVCVCVIIFIKLCILECDICESMCAILNI